MGATITGFLFLGLLVFVLVRQLCDALRKLGVAVPGWLPFVLMAALMVAFIARVFEPAGTMSIFAAPARCATVEETRAGTSRAHGFFAWQTCRDMESEKLPPHGLSRHN